jgi:hypothetical protein
MATPNRTGTEWYANNSIGGGMTVNGLTPDQLQSTFTNMFLANGQPVAPSKIGVLSRNQIGNSSNINSTSSKRIKEWIEEESLETHMANINRSN